MTTVIIAICDFFQIPSCQHIITLLNYIVLAIYFINLNNSRFWLNRNYRLGSIFLMCVLYNLTAACMVTDNERCVTVT